MHDCTLRIITYLFHSGAYVRVSWLEYLKARTKYFQDSTCSKESCLSHWELLMTGKHKIMSKADDEMLVVLLLPWYEVRQWWMAFCNQGRHCIWVQLCIHFSECRSWSPYQVGYLHEAYIVLEWNQLCRWQFSQINVMCCEVFPQCRVLMDHEHHYPCHVNEWVLKALFTKDIDLVIALVDAIWQVQHHAHLSRICNRSYLKRRT